MNEKSDSEVLALALTSTEKLHREFDGIFSPETVRLCLEESAKSLMGAHLPVTSRYSRTGSLESD